MKQVLLKILGVLLAACIVTLAVFAVIVHQETADLGTGEMLGRTYLLPDEQMAAAQLSFQNRVVASVEFPDGVLIHAEETWSATMSLESEGSVNIVAVYAAPELNLFENPVYFTVGSHTFTSELSFLWADDLATIRTDRYGNEVVPEPYQMPYAANYLEDHEAFSGLPLEMVLPAGETQISITPQNQGLTLYGIYAVTPKEDIPYTQYLASVPADVYSGQMLTRQGEDYRAKSDSSIRGANVSNVSLYPSSPYVKLINATADKSNKRIGQKVYYEIEVPEDGIYYLS